MSDREENCQPNTLSHFRSLQLPFLGSLLSLISVLYTVYTVLYLKAKSWAQQDRPYRKRHEGEEYPWARRRCWEAPCPQDPLLHVWSRIWGFTFLRTGKICLGVQKREHEHSGTNRHAHCSSVKPPFRWRKARCLCIEHWLHLGHCPCMPSSSHTLQTISQELVFPGEIWSLAAAKDVF